MTFDWWHTIAEPPWRDYDVVMKNLRLQAVQDCLRGLGIDLDRGTMEKAHDAHAQLLKKAWSEDIDLSADEQIRSFLNLAHLSELGEDVKKAVKQAYAQAFLTKLPRLNPGVREALLQLREDGYSLGLISNTGRSWGEVLRISMKGLNILDFFDTLTFSDEEGIRKPNPRIFARTVDRLGVEPREAVHVGDDTTADVEGARKFGMKTVWYNNGFWDGARCNFADAEISLLHDVPRVVIRW